MNKKVSEEYKNHEGIDPTIDNPACTVLSIDATDIRENPGVTGKNQGYTIQGGEDSGNLSYLSGTSDTRKLEEEFKIFASSLDVALESPESIFPANVATALLEHATANLTNLKSVHDEKSKKLAEMRVKYRSRNGGVTSELFGVQKTWISMIRRLVDIARAGAEACSSIIDLLTPGGDPLEFFDLMNLAESLKFYFQALITPASHYMPLMLSSFSNRITVVVGRMYFKAIANEALFSILDKVGEAVMKLSGGTVVVAAEVFDGAHRARIKGGGQYWAHQAEDSVNSLISKPTFAGPQSMLGKAQRVEILSERAIQLLLEGPPPNPTALTEAGIFAPPIAVPRAAVMAEVTHFDADPNANELAEAGASE